MFPYLVDAHRLVAPDKSVGYDLPMELKDRVRQLREQKGLSQQALGELAGLDKETVNRTELGANVTAKTINKIAIALETTAAEIYASLMSGPESRGNVEDGVVDVSSYTPHDIPVVTEGEASPQGSLFWSEDGALQNNVEDRISRPRDVSDPHAFAVRVRGDSMLPVFKPGMLLIISPHIPVRDGDEVYVELLSGERLVKIARRTSGGWILESTNPTYPPRVVTQQEVGAMHPVMYARRKR